MVFCDNCGHKLRSTSKFCGSCGTQTESIEDTPKTRRSKPARPRKKSRAEELAEYEEGYISRSKNTKSKSKTTASKQNVNTRNVLQRPPEWKSMGVTIVLTVVLGIFGFGGIGHLYLGKIIKGIVILIVGIILLIITIFTMGIGIIALIPYAIWVVYDSYKLCKHYNDELEQTGRPPW